MMTDQQKHSPTAPCENAPTLARSDAATQFACDAMLGGLARWLRAAGYDAAWRADIDDWDLIRLARREGRVLLSCDTGIFKIGIVRDGDVAALLIPHGLSKQSQLVFVMEKLKLEARQPRCMACGGELAAVPKEAVRDRAPPRSFAWLDRFFQCTRCDKLFWEGTHWRRIERVLEMSGRGIAPQPETGAATEGL